MRDFDQKPSKAARRALISARRQYKILNEGGKYLIAIRRPRKKKIAA